MEKPKIENANEAKESIESKEKESKLKIWVLDSSKPFSLSLKRAMAALSDVEMKVYFDRKKALEELESEGGPDLLYLGSFQEPSRVGWEDETAIKIITQIRNNPEIKKQPVILRASFDKRYLKKNIEAGADFGLEMPFSLVDLLKNIHSVPEMINNLETRYGDKMFYNKQRFYKEYHNKLQERSEETADTEKELEILREILKENRAENILDAGMGEGRLAIPLIKEGFNLTGIDSSPDLIEKAKRKFPEGKFFEGDLRKLPVKEGSQDAITYNWHIFADILGNKPKEDALKEAYRALKNDGVVVLDLPDREFADFKKDGIYMGRPGGEQTFIGYVPTEKEMIGFLEKAGFENIETKKWETKNGIHKITFMAKKKQNAH
jgi:ubiquinone/menaquinone biosynthesis C-methylase UbiE